jgi:hypothetical protein
MRYYNYQYDYGNCSSSEKDVDDFLKRHEATGEISRRRFYAKRAPIGRVDWSVGTIPDILVEREPMVEINMPKHRFQDLVERERFYSQVERESEYYKRIVDQYRNDERIRDRNPTVQKAYEKYLMLLELAR